MKTQKLISLDWCHEQEKINAYNGKKFLAVPKPNKALTILAENIPAKLAKPYIDAGATVLRCSPNAIKDLRGDQDKEEDAKLIYDLYQAKPQAFRKYTIEPKVASLYACFKEVQKTRVALGNRLFANDDTRTKEVFELLETAESKIHEEVAKELETHPIYDWLKSIKGIGPSMAGGLISYIGDISRFHNVTGLWSYFGLACDKEGKARKKKKGVAANWHQKAKSLCFLIGESFIKQRTPLYRDLYDQEKVKQLARGLTAGHAHARSLRKSVKIFLQHTWLKMRELAGLSVTLPWIIQHGGHSNYIEALPWTPNV